MPFKKDITTYCIQNEGFSKLSEKIKEEIAKNHQIIIIYPVRGILKRTCNYP